MASIETLFNEWQSLQPLKKEDQIRLDRKFMLEFNYNSNHLEGNTLTFGQTEFLLMFGKAVDNANMKDLEDMKASNVALQKVVVESEDKERPLTEAFIRELHHTLLREDYVETREDINGVLRSYTVHAGIYKTRPNTVKTVTGEYFEYASPEETPALMSDLVQWYNEESQNNQLSPIELAALFHYRYIRIHPFEDGNGRVSRLLANYILHRRGYPMIVVKSDDKTNYLFALNQCDTVVGPVPAVGAKASIEQISPFVKYLSNCLERALIVSIKAARGENIEEEDDFAKQLAIIERTAKKVIPQNAHRVTPQDKLDVFNVFHRQLADKLIRSLEPAIQFYTSFTVLYFMTKDRDQISGNGFFTLDRNRVLSEDMPKSNLQVLNEAQCIMLHINLQGVKTIYNMKDHPIYLRASVFFEETQYSFDNKNYQYGSYPSLKEQDDFIGRVKDKVLKEIQQSLV